MSVNGPAVDDRAGSALRRPTAWLAALGVAVLLAAAFVLSYDAFAGLARAGGVSPRLARYYPGVLDATLVVAFAALFVLRTSRWFVRLLTWFAVIILLAVCAAAAAVHATHIHLPRLPLAAGVAIAPFLLLVLAFRLWLTMLRHIRRSAADRRAAAAAYAARAPEPAAVEARPSPLALLPGAAPELEEWHESAAPARGAVEPDPAVYDRAEPEGAVYEDETVEPETGTYEEEQLYAETTAGGEHGGYERPLIGGPRQPTLEDLAAVVELPEIDDPAALLEPDADNLDEDRPPLPRRQRARTDDELGDDDDDGGELGDEDELIFDDGPDADPASDEADDAHDADGAGLAAAVGFVEAARPSDTAGAAGSADEVRTDDLPGGAADPMSDEPEPVADERDELDEFAELELDAADVPPPPSHRVRSSPLPPLDWGPGLGGLPGGRRRG